MPSTRALVTLKIRFVVENLPMQSQRHWSQVITRNTRFFVPQECMEELSAVLGANLRRKESFR
jgi:hypothetical protein